MSSEQGYFYSFHHADPAIIAQIVEDWGSKGNAVQMMGNELWHLYRGDRLFGWAIYNLLTTTETTKERSDEASDLAEARIRAFSPAKVNHFHGIVEKNWHKAGFEFKTIIFPELDEVQEAA